MEICILLMTNSPVKIRIHKQLEKTCSINISKYFSCVTKDLKDWLTWLHPECHMLEIFNNFSFDI